MLPDFTAIHDYYNRRLPDGVPFKVAFSFVGIAAVHLYVGCSMPVALAMGTIAATAIIIESVTRPIIQDIFPDHPLVVRAIQSVCQCCVVFNLCSLSPWVDVNNRAASSMGTLWTILNIYNNPLARNVG